QARLPRRACAHTSPSTLTAVCQCGSATVPAPRRPRTESILQQIPSHHRLEVDVTTLLPTTSPTHPPVRAAKRFLRTQYWSGESRTGRRLKRRATGAERTALSYCENFEKKMAL